MLSTPLPTYAKDYQSTVHLTSNLLNDCSSEHSSINCANNNAETVGDENNVSPQVTQSSQLETGFRWRARATRASRTKILHLNTQITNVMIAQTGYTNALTILILTSGFPKPVTSVE